MSFASDMSKWCKQTMPQTMEKVVRRVVIEVANRAIFNSPVGDPSYWINPPPPGYAGGQFRRNWVYGFNSPPVGYINDIDPSGQKTLAAIMSSAHGKAGVHYIANNVPYAQRIENGWSRQAPQGIVGRIELELPEIFTRAVAQA